MSADFEAASAWFLDKRYINQSYTVKSPEVNSKDFFLPTLFTKIIVKGRLQNAPMRNPVSSHCEFVLSVFMWEFSLCRYGMKGAVHPNVIPSDTAKSIPENEKYKIILE